MRGCLCTLFGTESRTSQMARPNPLDLTVCPTPDHGISVDDCAKTENLYRSYEAVLRPSTVLGLKTASYDLYRVLCRSQSAIKMPSKVATGALIFTCTPSYVQAYCCFQSESNPKPMPGMETEWKDNSSRGGKAALRRLRKT